MIFCPLSLGPSIYEDLGKRVSDQGLYVTAANPQIDGFAQHDGEYVNVFHDPGYLRNRWSRYFEVVAILPGYIFTHDLVVLRKA